MELSVAKKVERKKSLIFRLFKLFSLQTFSWFPVNNHINNFTNSNTNNNNNNNNNNDNNLGCDTIEINLVYFFKTSLFILYLVCLSPMLPIWQVHAVPTCQPSFNFWLQQWVYRDAKNLEIIHWI